MCCDRINTDTLLANLFAFSSRNCYTFEELTKYFDCLRSFSAMYVASDFCENSVRQCINRYPTLFRMYEDMGQSPVVYAGTARPNLKFFNAAYSTDMQDYIQRVTDFYVSGLPEETEPVDVEASEAYELSVAAN